MRIRLLASSFAAALFAACSGAGDPKAPPTVVRIGHFPNVTHAHGLVGHALTRRGQGIFEKHLGPGVKVEWFVFNAGPTAMEGLMAGSLDATYVGPNPALNAHVRTAGNEVRVLGGATNGGSALVVREAAGITTASQLRGRRVATPQLGNTQDVACRAWLVAQGFVVTMTGGDVAVVPTENPDQLALFQQGQIDAAWTVEPWVSRLELEGGGKVFVEEPDAISTVFVARAALVEHHPAVAARLRAAHAELTQWLVANPGPARDLVRGELEAVTGRPIRAELVERCWRRLGFTAEVRLEAFQSFLDKARSVGLSSGSPDLGKLLVGPLSAEPAELRK